MEYLAKNASKLMFVGRGGVPPLPTAELASTLTDFLQGMEDHGFSVQAYLTDQRRYKKLPRSNAAQFVVEHLQNDETIRLTFIPPGATINSGTGAGITHWWWDASTARQTYPSRCGAELTMSIESDAPPWLLDLFLHKAIQFAYASGLPQSVLSPHNPPALYPAHSQFDRARDARHEVFTPRWPERISARSAGRRGWERLCFNASQQVLTSISGRFSSPC